MIGKTAFSVWCSILLLPGIVSADSLSQRFQAEPAGGKFASTETTFDAFADLRVPEHKDIFSGRLGFGLGVNHFFTPYLGVGADTHIEKVDWPNRINGSVIGRYPIEKWSLAPYAFVGFGRQFNDTAQWLFHFGGGLDYRLNPKAGLFLDVRQTWPDVSRDFMLWRFGLRLGF
jgi:hypothetical protein